MAGRSIRNSSLVDPGNTGRLGWLAHFVARYRWPVIAAWIVLTLFGGVAAGKLSTRWYQSLAVPGKPAYEGSQRTLAAFGVGVRPPNVVVFHSPNADLTKSTAVRAAMARVAKANPGALTSSYFSTGAAMYVSHDRHTVFQQVYQPGQHRLDVMSGVEKMKAVAAAGLPAGISVDVTGHDALVEASKVGKSGGSSVLLEAVIGGIGALVILLFVFGTLPAVLLPLVVAVAAILNTFTLVLALTYITDVSVIVQFLIALVGLGVAIDYALLMVFRFRDELRDGKDSETALVETMTHAGHSVIVSGTTVAIGLLAMVVLPVPLLRGVGLGGMLIPIVSVLAAITLLPAMLAVLGNRVNRLRVMPRRLIDSGHPEAGAWGRWARFVIRRPIPVAAVGITIVALLAGLGTQLNPSEAQLKYFPGTGTAIAARDQLAAAGISPGVIKPLDVLVENGGNAQLVAAKLRAVPGVVGATAPPSWHRGQDSLVEGFAAIDGAAPGIQGIIDRTKASLEGTDGTLTGTAAVDRDFLHALSGQLPLRARTDRAPDADPAHARVPLPRPRRQGRGAEPPLARRCLRDRRLRLPAGARLLALGRRGRPRDHGLHPGGDLRLPVRALDGLRGVHDLAHAGGIRRDRLHRQGDRARPRTNRQARDQRRPDPHVRLPRALIEPRV